MNTIRSILSVAARLVAPPAQRGLISGAFLAGLAALFLTAAPTAEAQEARTYTFTASVNGGPVCTDCQANEGDTFTLTLTISGLTAGEASTNSVDFGGTATAGEDYIDGRANRWRISSVVAGDRNADGDPDLVRSQSYNVVDDIPAEDAETITISVPTVTGTFTTDTFSTTSVGITITISQNEEGYVANRTLTVTGPATITENDDTTDGMASGDYTITLRGIAFRATSTTVTWMVVHGDTVNADFVAPGDRTGTVTFNAGEGEGTTKTFSFDVAGDDLNEADETFTVQVSVVDPVADSGTGYGTPQSVTITDDDPVTVAIARHSGCAATVTEGAATNTCDFTITVGGGTRASGVSLTLPFTVSGDGVTTADYSITAPTGATAPGGTLTFAQADTSVTLTLAITDDDLNEATETITVTGAAVGASGLRLSGTAGTFGAIEYTTGGNAAEVMVTDNDDIEVRIARVGSGAVDEGMNAQFTVSLVQDGANTAATSQADICVPFTTVISTQQPPTRPAPHRRHRRRDERRQPRHPRANCAGGAQQVSATGRGHRQRRSRDRRIDRHAQHRAAPRFD